MGAIRDHAPGGADTLVLVESACSICGTRDQARLLATGVDFEYATSTDVFSMYHCLRCDCLFLDPRPARSELGRIYPDEYHAYEFTPDGFGFAFRARRWIEKGRLLDWCESVPSGGSIVDIGSGDGFHLDILREYGDPTWSLEAVEPDPKALEALDLRGFTVHRGFLEDLDLAPDMFDFALMIMVVEHVDDPQAILTEVHRVLKPGGAVGIVTDNIRSLDARLGKRRHWGGYHFPRHFNLFSQRSLGELAQRSGFTVERMETMVSPVNWTYTIHNYLTDHRAPQILTDRFTLRSPLALGVFTVVDQLARLTGRGALLRALIRKPG